jgi:hypothetical protein
MSLPYSPPHSRIITRTRTSHSPRVQSSRSNLECLSCFRCASATFYTSCSRCLPARTPTHPLTALQHKNSGKRVDERELRSLMYPHFPRLVSRTPNPVLLMTDILEALALLADSNIVHRDVKPENVMLSSS